MAGSIDALACSSLIQCINCNLYQQTCKHTGLKLVSSCDCFPFWSWDTTLFHSCLYSALIRLGCFLLLQLFLQLGDMFTSDCFLQVLWSHTCDLYPNLSLLVWAPLSWLTTCQSSSTAYRQLDNNQVNYSESQKSVLRQETVCTSCWLWDNAPNVVILGASVCPGVGCYNLVLCKSFSNSPT